MLNRRQRRAISQAEIAKRCDKWATVCRGTAAFRKGLPRHANPCGEKYRQAWYQGWDMACDKQLEKDNE